MIVESIKDVSENTFVHEVIEKSKEKIVIVDFWAPCCLLYTSDAADDP